MPVVVAVEEEIRARVRVRLMVFAIGPENSDLDGVISARRRGEEKEKEEE